MKKKKATKNKKDIHKEMADIMVKSATGRLACKESESLAMPTPTAEKEPEDVFGFESFTSPESSNIFGAEYSLEKKILWVKFKDNKDSDAPRSSYQYDHVPESIWQGLKTAPSKGNYFRANILNKFDTTKLWAS